MTEVVRLIVSLGIYNVWLLRFDKATPYRGGEAKNMKEEFASYGLSERFMKTIGFFKLLTATLILLGFWFPTLELIGALGLSALMAGAVAMHLKVKDPIKKALPALGMLSMSLFLLLQAGVL